MPVLITLNELASTFDHFPFNISDIKQVGNNSSLPVLSLKRGDVSQNRAYLTS